MTPEPCTRWTIVGMPGMPRLNIELVVATKAPAVIERIEWAAEEAGVQLQLQIPEES